MDESEARLRLSKARVATLATVDESGAPHLVPFVFAIEGDMLYSAVDHKPKSSMRLRRLANIEQNPRVSVLAEEYADDWSQLWWVRADGEARIIPTGHDWDRAIELLADKYPQYRGQPPTGDVIAVRMTKVVGWKAAA